MLKTFPLSNKNKMKASYCDIRRCRLCGCEEGFVEFKNIFEDNPDLELELKIAKLLPIVVMPWDPMPHKMCSDCIDKLNLFYEFYENVLKTDRYLRTFYPSAPESEIENFDPIIQINDYVGLFKNSLKLPSKNFSEILNPSMSCNGTSQKLKQNSAEVELSEKSKGVNNVLAERTLDRFIINPITNTDSVFTCRECYRTYTKKSSALTHICVRLEDYEELEIDGINSKKSLPPLKIRLFSVVSGRFICDLCQKPFPKKADVVEHLKRHSLVTKSPKKCKKKVTARKRKKINSKFSGKETKIHCNLESSKLCEEVEISDESNDNQVSEKNSQGILILPEKRTNDLQVKTKGKNECDVAEEKPKIFNLPEAKGRADDGTFQIVFNDTNSDKDAGGSLFSCVICDKVFLKKSSLIAHQNIHLQNSDSYSKNNIKLEDKRVDSLDSSNNSCSKDVFLCRICGMIFTKKKLLIDHEHFHYVVPLG